MNDYVADRVTGWIEEERLVQTSRIPEQVYIRFGMFSRLARSYNFSTHKGERGLSVYPAIIVDGAAELANDAYLNITAYDAAHLLEGRLVFVVTGKVVCRGSDGEPVLQQVKLVPCAVSTKVADLWLGKW